MPNAPQFYPVADLRPHPRLERVWRMDDALLYISDFRADLPGDEIAQNWVAFRDSVEASGILEPLKVVLDDDGRGQIVDGRHRYAAAVELGRPVVPVQVVDPASAELIMVESVVGRRQWTKGQLAYFAVLMCPEVVESRPGGDRQKHSDSIGMVGQKHSDSIGMVVPDRTKLARRFGVSADLIDQAAKLYSIFSKSEKTRTRLEPGIWAGQGLGAILAGLAGKAATEGQPRRPSGFDSADKAARSLASRLRLFGSWPEHEREIFRDTFGETLSGLDSETRAALREALAKADALATEAEMEGGAE